jgi:Zn-dependent peptidase ImmA (M78 family)
MSKIFPNVEWISNEEAEELAGYKRKYKKSWIKGIFDRKVNVIYLNICIMGLKHPIFYETECLFHEFFHFISRHPKIDRIFDEVSLIIDIHLYNHNCRRNYRRKDKWR